MFLFQTCVNVSNASFHAVPFPVCRKQMAEYGHMTAHQEYWIELETFLNLEGSFDIELRDNSIKFLCPDFPQWSGTTSYYWIKYLLENFFKKSISAAFTLQSRLDIDSDSQPQYWQFLFVAMSKFLYQNVYTVYIYFRKSVYKNEVEKTIPYADRWA